MYRSEEAEPLRVWFVASVLYALSLALLLFGPSQIIRPSALDLIAPTGQSSNLTNVQAAQGCTFTVSGRVTDTRGMALSGASVGIKLAGGSGPAYISVVTGTDGRFRLFESGTSSCFGVDRYLRVSRYGFFDSLLQGPIANGAEIEVQLRERRIP